MSSKIIYTYPVDSHGANLIMVTTISGAVKQLK